MADSIIRPYTSVPLDFPDPGLGGATTVWAPKLKVRVAAGGKHFQKFTPLLPAYVDSGSPYCLFNSAVADFLHIKLKGGDEGSLGGVIGGVKDPVYFHRVVLSIDNHWMINVLAGFAKKLSVVGILGRRGFFDRFQVKFDHSTSPPQFELTKIDLIN